MSNFSEARPTEPEALTHAAALTGNQIGLPVPACAGLLKLLGSHEDTTYTADGVKREKVYLYRCEQCNRRVSVRGGRAINDYEIVEPEGLSR